MAACLSPWVSTPTTISSRYPQSLSFCQHHQVFPTPAPGTEENFQLPPMRRGSLFQRAIGRDVRVRYSSSLSSARLSSTMLTTGWPIYFTAVLAVFCDRLRELFNAELRAFATRGICQTAACGVILLSAASPVSLQFSRNVRTGIRVSGRNAATRAAICLSSSGLLTARLPARSLWIIGHFCRCRQATLKIAVAGKILEDEGLVIRLFL